MPATQAHRVLRARRKRSSPCSARRTAMSAAVLAVAFGELRDGAVRGLLSSDAGRHAADAPARHAARAPAR